MPRNVSLTLLIFLCSFRLSAQPLSELEESMIKQCLDEIYTMNFHKADSILSLYEAQRAFNPSFYILKSYYIRWKHLPIAEGTTAYKRYYSYLDSAITYSGSTLKANPDDLEASYYKMSAHIMISELLAANGDFVKGAIEGRKAFPFIKKGFDLYSENPEFCISTALYNYYIEHYREKGFFYRSLLFTFPKGDKKKGLQLLSEGHNKGLFTSVECLLYLAHLNFKMENKPFVGLGHCKILYEEYPANERFQEMYIENLLQCKKYSAAAKVLQQFKRSDNDYYKPKAILFEAIINLEKNKNLPLAKRYLLKSIEQLESLPGDNDHFKSLAFLKLAQLEEINGNLADSSQWLKKAKKLAKYNYILVEVNKLDT